MADFDVGDKVVYAPHGAGVVVAKEDRGDTFGEYLSIRIAHSKMTLMVPVDKALEKGVRPIIDAKEARKLLRGLAGDAEVLPEKPQDRARQTADKTRGGGADELASILRDYTNRAREGKKLSIAEQKSLDTAKQMLASEIALSTDIDIEAAAQQLDEALGLPEES